MNFINANQEPIEYDGSPLTWRVSAYALIKKDNKILIIKNMNENLYDIVGGGIEFGETIEQGLQREAIEEGGAVIKMGKLLHAEVGWLFIKTTGFHQTLQLFYEAELVGELGVATEGTTEWLDFVDPAEVGKKYRLPKTVERVIKKNFF